jgi:glyoxylate reductase
MHVLVTGNLPDAEIDRIEREHRVQVHRGDCPMERRAVLDSIGDKQGLLSMITDRVDAQLLDRAPELKIIANFGVGYNNIDVTAATRRGIMVTNTPGVLTDATADLTMALMLAVARRVVEGDQRTRQGRFRFWAPFHFLGHEITGKTLGIVGMGRIGRAVARRAAGFEMRVLYHNRNPLTVEEEQALGTQYADLKTLLQEADFISLHTPLTPRTRHLIGSRELSWMKSHAFIINTARGAVIDEQALVEALEQGRIAGAGLDVYENEPALTSGLERLDNVVLLPHVGSATVETRRRMAAMAVDNLLAGLQGRTPPNCVNPNVATLG